MNAATRAKAREDEPSSKAQRTRARILEGAAVVFARNGYHHARIQDIAAEAGTQPSAIYYYFPSRTALVREVLAGSVKRVWRSVEDGVAALPSDASFSDRIRRGVISHVAFVLAGDPFVRAYARIENQVTPEERVAYSEDPRGYAGFWKALLGEAQAAGELRADLDLRVARQMLLGALVWTSDWYRAGKLTPEQIGELIADIFLQGVNRT